MNLQETINYHYERNCCDPRIQHDFVLEVDEYGNVIKSASITYPRRIEPNNYSEQQKLHATLERNFYVNNTKEFYLLGALYKSQAFEIGGLRVAVSGYTNINDLRTHVTQSLQNTIKFEENLNYTSPQVRLLSESHNYFWNKEQNSTLPLGSVTQQALLHHTEAMAFSDSQIKEVFSGKITSEQMLKDLGYKKTSDFWWAPSPTQYYYGSDKYYLPEKVIDVFGSETAVIYDQYNLLPIKTIVKATESSNYETTAEYDYQRLSSVKLTDHNDNVSEVILNPLGVVIATSVYGSENGEKKGDKPLLEYQVRKNPNFEDVLGIAEGANGPEYYLQNATSFFYYDLKAWRKNGQPVHVINLQRETHVSEVSSTRIRRVITHIDGFGRNLETKMLVDSEHEKWLASGRVVYNNKGTEVKKYEPFYSNFPLYDFEESVRNQGVSDTLYYDPLLRNIRIDTAKGVFSKIEFDSWTTKNFDLNDTVKDSEYYREFNERWNRANTAEKAALKDEKDALDKAEKHYNTPTIEHLDSLGRKFLQIETLSKDGQSNVELKSHVKLDIQGNELESVDSRFYEQNQSKQENEKVKNFHHVYSMAGLLESTSIDVGETWNLANVAGSGVYSWNSRGICTCTEYDRLQRPTKVKVTNQKLKLDNIVERFFYSEDIQDKSTNRYGTLIAHYDQAGLTEVKENDFKGQTLKSNYTLRKNYKQEANWGDSITTHTDLEQEVFYSSVKYNAIGEIIEKTDSQNNMHTPVYDIAGRVRQIKLKKTGETIKTYVSNISYNPKGQRTSITYGNGVVTSYSYDSKTFRLIKLESVKEKKKLQSINYTYDPIGNITTMEDESYKTIFPNNKTIDTKSDYHYDSVYRLIEATGKEHPALSGKEEVITPIPHLNNQNAISNYTEYYDFDYGSNITRIRHNGKNSSTKEFYISNKSNRSLQVVDERPVNENNINESYDERGNLLKLSGTQNLHWNYRDNIAHVDIITRPSGKNDSEYYVYDSSGQRVRKVTETYQNNERNSTRVEKIYFGDIEVTRTYQDNNLNKEKYTLHVADDKSRVVLHHYWTKGTPDETQNSQNRYQLSNHLDSVALELNDNAEIMSYEEYLPFGGTALIAGKTVREVTEKEYKYSGKERDDSTGLYYYGARYYAPWLARWINPDPAGTVDGFNLYQFVRGNPINSVDDGGMSSKRKRTEDAGSNKKSSKKRKQAPFLPRTQQPLTEYYQRPSSSSNSSMAMNHYGNKKPGSKQEIISNSIHGTERSLATFEVLGFIHGAYYAIGELPSGPIFQNAATHQDFSGTKKTAAAHTFGIGVVQSTIGSLNEKTQNYLFMLVGRTNPTEGGSSMNSGIEQSLDRGQYYTVDRYSYYPTMRDTDFTKIMNYLTIPLGKQRGTTAHFSEELIRGIENSQSKVRQAYDSNFRLGRLYSAPLNSIDYYGNYNLTQSEDITTQLAQLSITANNDSPVDMLNQQMQMLSINEPANNNHRPREEGSDDRNMRRRYG